MAMKPLFNKQKLTHLLRSWVKVHNKIPTQDLVNEDENMPHFQTFGKHFGSWGQALREAGLIQADTLKICKIHGQLIREDCYAYKCSRMVDGIKNHYIGYRCALCQNLKRKSWQEANPGKYKKAIAKWSANNPEKRRKYVKEYSKKNPEKVKARQILTRAIKSGIVVRLSCERCNNMHTDGHHPDYSKPLDVMWLCRPCHAKEHKMLRGKNHER